MKSRSRFAWYECLLCLAIGCATASPVKLATSDTVMLADFDDSTGAKLQRPMREALRVALDESPYLNLIPDAATERALQEAGRDDRPKKLAQICRAARAKVYVHAVLAATSQAGAFRGELDAVDCAGETRLAQQHFTSRQTGLI